MTNQDAQREIRQLNADLLFVKATVQALYFAFASLDPRSKGLASSWLGETARHMRNDEHDRKFHPHDIQQISNQLHELKHKIDNLPFDEPTP